VSLINHLIQRGDLAYYTFEPLNRFDQLAHGFSTRKGGTSLHPYDTLNLGLHVGDDKDYVIENRNKYINSLGFSLEEAVALDQIHGNNVVLVNELDKGRGMTSYEDCLSSTDGMITNKPGILLTTYYADCVPIYIYDPQTNSIGMAHAGWKGTLLKIGINIVSSLKKSFRVNPKDCVAVIGPSIGPCCYEVDERVLLPIKKAYSDYNSIISKEKSKKGFLNLWEANRLSLLEAGIIDQNIHISKLCTHCSKDYFFSHRRDNGRTGRMAAVMGLRR